MNTVAFLDDNAPSFPLHVSTYISHYEFLSRMGYLADKLSGAYRHLPPVYTITRDFAYDSAPVFVRMAQSNIGEASAKSFAEYVKSHSLPLCFKPNMFFLGSPARSHLWWAQMSDSEAKSVRKRLLSGPTVDIYVGKDRRHWSLHRNLLCNQSSYFEAEFIGNEVPKGRKASDNKLELPEDDPLGFELLVKWLYQGRLDDVSELPEEKKYDYSVACHKLYMLCEKFDMPMLKNTSVDQYRKGLWEAQLVPDAEEINEIYRHSPKGSPFRKLMTQIAARQIMDPDSDKDAESYRACFDNNADFAVDMVNAIKRGSGGMLFDDPTAGGECEYHDHSDGQNCHVKGKIRGK